MALSFSLNPHSPSLSSSSHSSFFLLRPHARSAYSAKPLRISCSHSQRLAEPDTGQQQQQQQQPRRIEVASPRKKRKPKPSFLDQIQAKWSVKSGSQRVSFPWQEQLGTETESTISESKNEPTETNERKQATSSDSVSFGLTGGVLSAPWAHGIRTRKKALKKPKQPLEISDSNENVNKFPVRVVDMNVSRDKENPVETETNSVPFIETVIGDKKDSILASSAYKLEDLAKYLSESDSESELETELESDCGVEDKFKWKRKRTAAAETTLPEHELKRLRNVSLRMPNRIKVGARGLTQEIVDTIRDKWELDEVVKLKFEEPLSLNMRRTQEILESKTGGLIIYSSGTLVVLYRGTAYKLPCVQSYTKRKPIDSESDPIKITIRNDTKDLVKTSKCSNPIPAERFEGLTDIEIERLNGLNELLEELGPRFTDWMGRHPLPVDADLLPGNVPGYKTPFRLLPYRVRPCVTNREMTKFRRIARTMPPHFALGRNRELQGLARAMVKLWEKSAIAKIAIKRGVENTRNEAMAEDLKRLTGGTLLSRNKEYIVFYRGNDFLSPDVTEALNERKRQRDLMQDEEEKIRETASVMIKSQTEASSEQLVAGTLAETKAATARWGGRPSSEDFEKMVKDSSMSRCRAVIKHLEKKLVLAKRNLTLAERALAKLQKDLKLSDLPDDLETLTEEERALFHKMGLSMKPFLLLGRRGFYSGTVENIHLHWKHRELVKIIMKAKHLEHVKLVATRLEAESGGVLVSVDKVMKGFAIVLYRGKNYRQPTKLKPQNLLTKRQALARSKEIQRREALRRHVSDIKERLELLKSELEKSRDADTIDNGKVSQSTEEYSFSSEDDELEYDSEESYLELQDYDGEEHEEDYLED